MTCNTVELLEARLAQLGLKPRRVGEGRRRLLVGRRSDFKLAWFATRMHTFVFVADFQQQPGGEELEEYLRFACRYAIEHKGGLPRGLQTGVGAVGIAVVPALDDAAVRWSSKTRVRWAAMSFPVVVDSSTLAVHHPKRMIVGGMYSRHFKRVTREVVAELGPASGLTAR